MRLSAKLEALPKGSGLRRLTVWISPIGFALACWALVTLVRLQSANGMAGQAALRLSQWTLRLPLAVTMAVAMGDLDLMINPVGSQGVENVNVSHVDLLYTEFWPLDHNRWGEAYDSYAAIHREIRNAARESGGKSLIVAAYINYQGPGATFNPPSVLLMDAVAFASGGARIELGNGDHMFPDTTAGIPTNVMFWGGWSCRSPEYVAQLKAFGIDADHLDATVFFKDNVRLARGLIDPEPNDLIAYLRELQGDDFDYTFDDEWGGVHTLQFYTYDDESD